jgi:hypothetical protein
MPIRASGFRLLQDARGTCDVTLYGTDLYRLLDPNPFAGWRLPPLERFTGGGFVTLDRWFRQPNIEAVFASLIQTASSIQTA